MSSCQKCGQEQWFLHNLFCQGESNGIGSAASQAYSGSDPSQGIGAGACAPALAAHNNLTAVHINAQVIAAQNAKASYRWIAAPSNMGVIGLQAGGLMQVHPPSQHVANLANQQMRQQLPAVREPPLETAPISVGEFVGWRIWRVRTRERLLLSYSADAIWLPGEPMEGKPTDHGHEGVWAFKDRLRAAAKVPELGEAGAIGSVWLWGNVVEHCDGYRGEFAEIRSIDGAPSDMLSALRARYGVGAAEDVENAASDTAY